jgi:hypothetical protein
MAKHTSRAGRTETFSVSVDGETKAVLRGLADQQFDGNMSALVKSFAEEAKRRAAAGAYLRSQGQIPMTPQEAAKLAVEVAAEARFPGISVRKSKSA